MACPDGRYSLSSRRKLTRFLGGLRAIGFPDCKEHPGAPRASGAAVRTVLALMIVVAYLPGGNYRVFSGFDV